VQGDLIAGVFNPVNWGALSSTGWGRSEQAAKLYDEILFHGATFADLDRGNGPLVVATATDIATGTRIGFHQGVFDILCSNLDAVPLSRAAAASSAVPFALSPVTINNYGGTCHYTLPPFLVAFTDAEKTPRPAARALTQLHDLQSYGVGNKPYIHLVDGGLSDNLGVRGVLEALEELSALQTLEIHTPLDSVKRIVVFVVNSLSAPDTHWDESESAPSDITLLIKATGVPIDHYSYDTVESLRDMIADWQKMRRIRDSAAFAANKNPEIAALLRTPNIDLYAIDVSFSKLKDEAERAYLNSLPTSFVLPPEAVDRLRAAAGKIILESPDFQRLLKEAGARIVVNPPPTPEGAAAH
jgi:NTE family protein